MKQEVRVCFEKLESIFKSNEKKEKEIKLSFICIIKQEQMYSIILKS